jgi:maleate isomerase
MNDALLSAPRQIGLMVPSSNTVMEPDFYRNLPHGWTLHTARMFLEDVTPEAEERMLDQHTFPAARDLATARVDILVFGCTSAGALRGNAFDDQMISEISRTTGIPAISTVRSVRETLKSTGAKKLVVITPYLDVINHKIQTSLETDGFEVLKIEGLGITQNVQIGRTPGDEIVALAKRAVYGYEPDALFVSCTNFPAVSVLAELRASFPFPVVTSNQAVLDCTMAKLMTP